MKPTPLPPTTPVTVAYGVDPKAVERMLALLHPSAGDMFKPGT